MAAAELEKTETELILRNSTRLSGQDFRKTYCCLSCKLNSCGQMEDDGTAKLGRRPEEEWEVKKLAKCLKPQSP